MGTAMTMNRNLFLCCIILGAVSNVYASSFSFDGAADNQLTDRGFYYTLTGSKFPNNNQTKNGSNGAIVFITDDPTWGYPIDTWNQIDWPVETSGLAVTLKDGADTVYDNNGIEDGTGSDFYQGDAGTGVAYSMANNFDLISAGAISLSDPTDVTDIISYFSRSGDPSDFNPDANWQYRVNLFSSDGSGLPVNSGGFSGNILSSDSVSGHFSWSDTGLARPDCAYGCGGPRPIWRLQYHLDDPVVLPAGDYFVSSDASATPEPFSIGLLLAGLTAIALRKALLIRSEVIS